MNKPLRLMFSVLFAILLISLFQVSCIFNGTSKNEEDTDPEDVIWIDTAILTSVVGADGLPIGNTRVFTTDTEEIYCTFWVSEDLCCKTVTVVWRYGDETIGSWNDQSGDTPSPVTVSIVQPEGGFHRGEYDIVIYIDIIETITIPFTVE
jgi:hypothetical protein